MKKLEKWLKNPLIQRLVYLLLLLFCLYLFKNNGNFHRLGSSSVSGISSTVYVLLPLLLLVTQLILNRVWLWWIVCAFFICFTLWLATLSMPQIIGLAGTGARTIVWWVGIFGFTLLLVLGLAFTNWVLLHMKPKK